MSDSFIFNAAFGFYIISVFVGVFALLRLRRKNEALREQVVALEAKLRQRYEEARFRTAGESDVSRGAEGVRRDGSNQNE